MLTPTFIAGHDFGMLFPLSKVIQENEFDWFWQDMLGMAPYTLEWCDIPKDEFAAKPPTGDSQ